ncbi:hypothetical protein Lesp02_63440 [Lentzea sp. NBRC 105346]|uniref:hypothetical protein n=1 Tax=Lentzea sp. NBRC 105346 TaxID=3032205 RepID=UPI0024A499B3|nr:hypothetical protein [Lentzea sp. NBRC 105346]GLZ34157.1 hypothetical protein Lesp02_63440 [Lentzea sp. NBRC 105346]
MQLRLASALIVLTLALGVTGCAQRIGGTAVAGAQKEVSETTSSKKPTSTKSTAPTTTSKSSSGSGDVKIKVEKKTTGYEVCEILKPADIAAAIGGKASGSGCVLSTENPYAVVSEIIGFADDLPADKKALEVGGNTAWQIEDKEGGCKVVIMLTDDPKAITPAYVVEVLEVDDIDSCGIALKLATLGFERLPNA